MGTNIFYPFTLTLEFDNTACFLRLQDLPHGVMIAVKNTELGYDKQII